MSRLRQLYVSDHYFFVTSRLARGRDLLAERDFQQLAESLHSARGNYGFFLTAWVFLPDHWHAIIYPRHPLTISTTMKSVKLKSTSLINAIRSQDGQLWQARFYDPCIENRWRLPLLCRLHSSESRPAWAGRDA